MKLAIYSDLHVGRRMYRTDENNYNKYEQLGYTILQQNVDTIKEEKPDLIINAGDIFDTPNPSVLAMNKYFTSQKALEDIPTMTILGNHDFAFNNRKNKCSAAEMASHTYFADYEIREIEIDDHLFVMMPYIYDTHENITKYMNQSMVIASASNCSKKILIAHGVTEKYYKDSFISDPIMLSNRHVELYDLVIIGHIHTPFAYKQKKTLVISPGSMVDYQAYEDRTGPFFLDTNDIDNYYRKLIKSPHIIKLSCNAENINQKLELVDENIYHISYTGDTELINNDLFIKAKNKAVNLVIDVVKQEESVDEDKKTELSLNIYEWIAQNYPDYTEVFTEAEEARH